METEEKKKVVRGPQPRQKLSFDDAVRMEKQIKKIYGSIQRFSLEIGVPYNTVRKIVRGVTGPQSMTMGRIAKGLRWTTHQAFPFLK